MAGNIKGELLATKGHIAQTGLGATLWGFWAGFTPTYTQTIALDIFIGRRYIIDARWGERPAHKGKVTHKGGG